MQSLQEMASVKAVGCKLTLGEYIINGVVQRAITDFIEPRVTHFVLS
ncbi:hypothetical protein JW960_15730 [candidate division KSB1 bacterium]|nr:hypothetical protein [candidate division KSB1 bacterium]